MKITKNTFFALLLSCAMALALTSCTGLPSVPQKNIAVKSVTLDVTELTLTVGKTYFLIETVSPNNATDKTVSWSSSDNEVATVSDGAVTALKAGTATITVTTNNEKTATCVVAVLENPENNDANTENGDDNTENNDPIVEGTEGFAYNLLDDGTYEVSVGGARNLSSIVIPSTYNGKTVTKIADYAFNYCLNLKNITIPDSVTSIGSYAFRSCLSLRSITIGDSVTSIGSSAFRSCSSLTSITIPDSVTSIDNNAFLYCNKLVEVINHSSLNITVGSSDYGLVACYAKEVHAGDSKIVNKDDYLFYTYDDVNYLVGYIGNDTELTLPEDYDGEDYGIYKYAFYYCKSLTSITISDSVTSIGDSAFSRCENLTSIAISDSVTSIGDRAFCSCSSLTSITIPDSVTSIGSSAFCSCSSLTSITIPDSVITIGKKAFCSCNSLMSVTFENPEGWWYSSSSNATSGTSISSSELSKASTAAGYLRGLRGTYCDYYWCRS